MFRENHAELLCFFTFYGILPENRKLSGFITLFYLTFGTGLYFWYAASMQMLATDWIETMSDIIYFVSYCSIVLTEYLILLFSLRKRKLFSEIYQSFDAVDKALQACFEAKVDQKKSSKQALKKIVLFVILTCVAMSIFFIDYSEDPQWMWNYLLNYTMMHVIQVKTLSFIFFIDRLNERFNTLIEVTKSKAETRSDLINIDSIYTDIYDLSRRIFLVYGTICSFIIYFGCSIVTLSTYTFFLKLSGINGDYSETGKL